ncbi:MAG: hypothetical protein EP338_12615 [Bacteroidetes bacterium]|nr:MAG: hypothetical protein EP338_12615 [Bacteroidota bacterium]
MQVLDYQSIEKEAVPSLSFRKEMTVNQHPDLQEHLEQATLLGNGYRTKVTIYFHDDEGPRKVQTTIWAAGANYICLKGGIWIPISRIEKIQF